MPAALDDDSRDSPAHHGRVGEQATSRMLLWGESSLIKISMATEAFMSHGGAACVYIWVIGASVCVCVCV